MFFCFFAQALAVSCPRFFLHSLRHCGLLNFMSSALPITRTYYQLQRPPHPQRSPHPQWSPHPLWPSHPPDPWPSHPFAFSFSFCFPIPLPSLFPFCFPFPFPFPFTSCRLFTDGCAVPRLMKICMTPGICWDHFFMAL